MKFLEAPVNRSYPVRNSRFLFSLALGLLTTMVMFQTGCGNPKETTECASTSGKAEVNSGSNRKTEPDPVAPPATPRSSAAESTSPKFDYAILHWNVESGGNDPTTVAGQLVELGSYDLIGLSEVNTPAAYEEALEKKWPGRYEFIRGLTGANEEREDDHLWIGFDTESFELVNSEEMKEIGEFVFDDGHHRVPLFARLKDKANGQEVIFIMNHFARGDKEFRQGQARTLREWARTKSIPIIAIGDYNLDFVFASQKGNKAFDEMMKDNVWRWVRPEPLIDTNWSDFDGDGIDNYIDSLLDFSFLAGTAKTWEATSHVIVRENDFPDNDKTSDHRPVVLNLKSN